MSRDAAPLVCWRCHTGGRDCPDLAGRPGIELVLVNGHPDSNRVDLGAR